MAITTRSPMPGRRVVIDGLWRCLCPSYDAIVFAQRKKYVGLIAARPDIFIPNSHRAVLSRRVQCRSLHGGRAIAGEARLLDYDRPKATATKRTEQFSSGVRARNPNWDELPIVELEDILQGLKQKEGEYHKIVELVKHLLKRTGDKPTLGHYDALVSGNSNPDHGSAVVVAKLLQDIKEENVIPDSKIYHSALQALAVHPDYVLRSEILKEMNDRWFTLSVNGWHDLIVGLLRDRQYEMALDKLEQMQVEEIRIQPWLYDMFIYLFCEAEELDEALRILRYRVENGDIDVSPNLWYAVLDVCSRHYHYDGTRYVWEKRVEKSLINPPDGMCMNVLNTAARYCDAHLATDVIRVLAGRKFKLDIHHYEALLEAYIGTGDLKIALRLLGIMKKSGLEPEEGTTRPIYAYLTTSPRLPTKAWKILRELHEEGYEVPVSAVNCVLEAYVSNSQQREALEKYKSFHTVCPAGPNTATINALLKNLVVLDDSKEVAMFLASEMASLSIRPDTLTFDRLILVCLREDDYEDAFRYLSEMKATFPRSILRAGTATALITMCVEKGDDRAWAVFEEFEKKGQATMKMRSSMKQAWNTPVGLEEPSTSAIR